MTRKRSSRSHEGIEFRIEVLEAEFKQLIVELLECGLRGDQPPFRRDRN